VTARELIAMLAAEPAENLDREIKVWLPGSRINLDGKGFIRLGNVLLIEGNVEEGSALS
jgi:hypothetical protein